MKLSIRFSVFLCTAVAVSITIPGCGVSQKTIDTYEAQLKALEAKGTPDSILSSVRVYLSQAKGGRQSANGTLAKASIDSVKRYLAAAEQWYQMTVQTKKPRVDSLLKYFTAAKTALSGMQVKEADSFLTIIDSYVKKNWYMQAAVFTDRLDTLMPSLIKDEDVSKKIGPQLIGTWIMIKKHTENGANATEKSSVSFKKDGVFEMNEAMNGQTKPTLREDWLFLTEGTYSMKGDTVLLATQKEKCVRQIYWNLVDKKGKQEWVKNEKKPYDSIIKDGSKDRFLTFDYLKEKFKK
ncbi:MAG: hypothetical protein ABSF80_04165 [Chitinispirillaceae bacterium]|jgi:hypothetical protein